jgi:hypothetical protein
LLRSPLPLNTLREIPRQKYEKRIFRAHTLQKESHKMISSQSLEQMLIDSDIARRFWERAHSGQFFDNATHDLYYDTQQDQLLEQHTQDQQLQYDQKEQLICRITGAEPTQYIWPEIKYKKFVEICLHDFQMFLHSPELQTALGVILDIEKDLQQQPQDQQQPQQKQHHPHRESETFIQPKQDMELEL